MPFYIGTLAIVYYLPYILFRIVNSDIMELKEDIASPGDNDTSTEKEGLRVANTYFRYDGILIVL